MAHPLFSLHALPALSSCKAPPFTSQKSFMSYGIGSALFRSNAMLTEQKTYGGTKRRAYSASVAPVSALSKRVTRLAKSLKAANPQHLYVWNATSAFANVSTTGTSLDLTSGIAQGDDYNQRFGSHVEVSHINIRMWASAGPNSILPEIIRCTILTGQSGLAFAANLQGSYSPLADSTSIRLLWDKFYQVSGSPGNPTFPTVIEKSLKVRHRQKFSAAAAGNSTGDTLYMIVQSGIATGGSLNPLINNGYVEVFFKP